MRFDDRMSDMDSLMWSIEKDPLLRSTITAVSILDRAPDPERLRAKIRKGLTDIPRLRQRAAPAPFNIGPPRWLFDPDFDLDYHVRWVKAPGAGTERDLLDIAEPIAMQSFDRARPLWEFVIVDGLQDGKAALIQKVHHSITDGVGGIKLALMLLDTERDAAASEQVGDVLPEPDRVPAWKLLTDAIDHERRRAMGIGLRSLGRALELWDEPFTVARRVQDIAASTARLVAPKFTPLSPLMSNRSLSVRFDTVRASLGDLKAAAKQADARLNDAFVAAVAGGLASYHRTQGHEVDALRMAMPINIRTDDAAVGNQFVPSRMEVPLTAEHPVDRMRLIRELVGRQRAEPALSISEPIAGVLTRLPLSLTTALFGGLLKGVDFITSNVPGVPFQVYLAGAAVEAQYAFGPMSGAALNVTLLSYVDEVHIGVNSDPAAVSDPELLLECLEESFEELRKIA
jgi:WS/DGAT/MGAT family acyltransferase